MKYIVTGTDTGIGKTVFAAGLAAALDATYWKPIQSGIDDGTDSEAVRWLGVRRTLAEAYRLTWPLSPHRSAELDGVEIDVERLALPEVGGPLVVEGAGGVLVPVTRRLLFADLFAAWGAPVILVARTGLGTINHSLLSVEALRARGVTVAGIAFVGDDNPDTIRTIGDFAQAPVLGRLPRIEPLDADALAAVFTAHIDLEAIRP